MWAFQKMQKCYWIVYATTDLGEVEMTLDILGRRPTGRTLYGDR